MPLLYQATAAFEGIASASQLTFKTGDKILVKDEASVNLQHGWGWGKLMVGPNSGQSGWFPSSYVKKLEDKADAEAMGLVYPSSKTNIETESLPTAVAVPINEASSSVLNNTATEEEDLFGMQPMGGTSSNTGTFSVSVPPYTSQSTNNNNPANNWNGFKLDGSRLRNARNSIFSASNTAVKTATPHVQNACTAAQNLVSKGIETVSVGGSSNNAAAAAAGAPRNHHPGTTVTTTTTSTGGWFSRNRTTTVVTTTTKPEPPSRGERMAGHIASFGAFKSVSSLMNGNAKGVAKGLGVTAVALVVEDNLSAKRKSSTQWR